MELTSVIYSPLKEDENQLAGWDKQTVDYIVKNRTALYKIIRTLGRAANRFLQTTDIDDIYMEVLEYAYKNDDYNITKAVELSNSDQVVSLTGYIHTFTRYIVLKYISDKYAEESKIISNEITDSNNDTVDIFDIIPDTRDSANSEMLVMDKLSELDTICKSCESKRYEYGLDIFQLWFIRLITMKHNKQDKYEAITESLGINKGELGSFQKKTHMDNIMLSIAKAVTILGVDNSIEVIRKYTYGAHRLEKVIQYY